MLQVISLRGGHSADYYVGLADDQVQRDGRERLARGPSDYYVDTGEPPGRWWGAQADAWGLTAGDGLVAQSDLRLLLDGKHPTTGAQLGRAYSDGGPRQSVRGFDATFSMPKSVSVLWAITTAPEVRAEIEAAGWAAVTATLDHLERVGAVTRIGPAGAQVQVDTGGLAAAIFEQHTNRSAEPQLHWHAVIAAKVDAGDGRWRALDAQFLKQHQSSLGYVFQAAVRSELTARLGASWGPTVKGSADLTGMNRDVIEAFATRSREVETAYGRLLAQWQDTTGRDQPNRLERHDLRHAAARASRGPKEPGYHPDDLHAGWRGDLRLAGIEPTDLEHEVLRRRVLPIHDLPHQTYEVALPAIEDLAAERGQWHHAELMKAIAARVTPRAATAADVVATLDTVASETLAAHALAIVPEPVDGVPRRADGRPLVERVVDRTWTTPQLWEVEEGLGSWALVAELMGGPRELTPIAHGLDPAQREAAAEVAGTRPLVVLVGPAGTGKTRLLEAARAQLDADFRPVIGLAVAAATAERLEDDTRLVCDTVAKLLHSADRPYRPGALPPPGTTVVIDEATQVTTQQWARLVDLAEAHAWRLVAVGDPAQIGAVGPGGIFASWVEQYRWTVQLVEVHRFTAEWERDASLRLRVGDTDALFEYADHGRIHRTSASTLTEDVIAHWDQHRRDRAEVLVSVGSNRLAGELGAALQAHRVAQGELAKDVRTAAVGGGQRIQPGEPLVTRRNDRRLLTSTGEWVRNGHQWTVTKVHENGSVTAQGRAPSQGDVFLPAPYLAEHGQLGYVVTRHVGQGATVDAALTVAEPGLDRAHLYSAMTRGRHENHVLVVCETADRDPVAILEDALAQDRQPQTANETRAQLIERHDAVARHWGWQREDGSNRRQDVQTRPAHRSMGLPAKSFETHGEALARVTSEISAIEARNRDHNAQCKVLGRQLDEITQGRGTVSSSTYGALGEAARSYRELCNSPPRFRTARALDRSQRALAEANARWELTSATEREPVQLTLRQVEQVMRSEWAVRKRLHDERDDHAWYVAQGGAALPTCTDLDLASAEHLPPRTRRQLHAIDRWHRHRPQPEPEHTTMASHLEVERTLTLHRDLGR